VSSAVLEMEHLAELKPASRKCANLVCGCVLSKSNPGNLCRTCEANEERLHLKGQRTDVRNRQRIAVNRADIHPGYVFASQISQRLPLPPPRPGPPRGAAILEESQRLRARHDSGDLDDWYVRRRYA
jgi:hypothetical protein